MIACQRPRLSHHLLLNSGLILIQVYLWIILTLNGVIQTSPGVDFYQFWSVSANLDAIAEGRLYDPEFGQHLWDKDASNPKGDTKLSLAHHRRTTMEVYGSPLFYMFFAALSGLTYTNAFLVWSWITIGSLFASILLLCWQRLGLFTCLLLILFSLSFLHPFRTELSVGNVNALQMLLYAISGWFMAKENQRESDWMIGGAMLAFLILFKPTAVFVPVVLLVFWAGFRMWRPLIYFTAGGTVSALSILLISSITFVNPRIWLDWAGVIADYPNFSMKVKDGNFALVNLVHHVSGIDLGKLPILVMAALIFGTIGSARRKTKRSFNQADLMKTHPVLYALGLSLFLFGSPLVWFHYFVLMLPLFFQLLPDPKPGEPDRLLRIVCYTGSAAFLIFWPALDLPFLNFLQQQLHLGIAVNCLLWILIAGLLIKLHRSITGSEESPSITPDLRPANGKVQEILA